MSDRLSRRVTVRVPATAGELAQGMLADGRTFHVTCPIDLYSYVTVVLNRSGAVVGPNDSPKALRGARLVLDALAKVAGVESPGLRLDVRSEIPRGKGMASSTADVAGSIAATAIALGVGLSPDEIARLCLKVEPTDGSVFPGLHLFDHREGRVSESLGVAPPLSLIVLDTGGAIDTAEFNGFERSQQLTLLSPLAEEALSLIRAGLRDVEYGKIGRGATLSALANQAILPKPDLTAAISYCEESGGLGVSVGHSGTIISLLFEPGKADFSHLVERLPLLTFLGEYRLISGGVEVISVSSNQEDLDSGEFVRETRREDGDSRKLGIG